MIEGKELDPSIDFVEVKPHHNCGVSAACLEDGSNSKTAIAIAGMLAHLQHRGPDGAGLAVMSMNDGLSIAYRDAGPVRDVLTASNISGLPDGQIGIGHTRYPTRGNSGRAGLKALQPIYREDFWMAANGEFSFDSIDGFASDTDKFSRLTRKQVAWGRTLPGAIIKVASELPNSAFSLAAMDKDALHILRDPNGFHPFFYGYSEGQKGFLIASEKPALTNWGVHGVTEVKPGQIIKFLPGEEPDVRYFVENPIDDANICFLEEAYFARSDGQLEGADIYETRKSAGRLLALRDKDLEYDVVMPVPDSARSAAQGYAEIAGKPYTEGLIKINNDRSFLQPTQEERQKVADHKLQIIPSQIRGKRIVLFEDSIVRGTTLKNLVDRLKKFGAKEVHLRIASPMISHECHYGVDIHSREELIAFQKNGSSEEIRRSLGADSLKYLQIPEARLTLGPKIGKSACFHCFNGIKPENNFVYYDPFN